LTLNVIFLSLRRFAWPYNGGANAVTDLLGGTIHINIGTLATLLPLIRSGKVRAIGNWSAQRSPDLPEVPTMIESGFPGLSVGFWAGLWAPAGTPQPIVAKLNAATNAALGSAEMKTAMHRLGFEGRPGSPKDFANFIASEAPRWAEFVKASGVAIN
jgi:tripartite-type tricarboxylate transporter receptor subunit TctC